MPSADVGVARPAPGRRLPAALVASVAGSVLVTLGTALALALAVPALSTADEAAHLDHAHQLWNGRFPVFEEGVEFVRGQELPPTAKVGTVQWTSHHPPLYYALAAPLVGPPAERGDWMQAALSGRVLSVALAGGCAVALAWAGSLVAVRDRAVWAAATAAVAAPLPVFVRDSATAYSDVLAVLLTVLAIGVGILVLRRGTTPGRVVAAALVAVLGMSARASFGLTLALLLCCLVAASVLHPQRRGADRADDEARRWPRDLSRGVAAATAVAAVALLGSGWFYLRNRRLTGHLTGARPEWALERLGRVEVRMLDVVTGRDYWVVYSDWFLRGSLGDLGWLTYGVLAALLAGTLVAVAVRLGRRSVDRYGVAVGLLLAAQLGGVLAVQAVYRTGGGGMTARYLLPALLPMAVSLVGGLLLWRGNRGSWVRGGVVALLSLGCWLTAFARFDMAEAIEAGRTVNGVPVAVVVGALVVAGAGVVFQSVGLVVLAGRRPRDHRPSSATAGVSQTQRAGSGSMGRVSTQPRLRDAEGR